MKKYISFLRLRLVTGLQYRAAALAGVVTQFFWGFMEIILLKAFYEADPAAYPMTMEATCAYIWLQQAFLAFFNAWMFEGEILNSISNGNISYELCRPINIYDMWFVRSVALRLSRAFLRCFPILIVAVLLPKPYGISAPASLLHFVLFLLSLTLGLLIMVALSMLVYISAFYTVSSDGIKILFNSAVELLAGQIIPLPFFPQKVQNVLEILPFASLQNVALRIYSGNLAGSDIQRAILLQFFWLIILVVGGRLLCSRAQKRVIVQGG